MLSLCRLALVYVVKKLPEKEFPPSFGIMLARTPPVIVSAETALVSNWYSSISPGSMLWAISVPDPPRVRRTPSNSLVVIPAAAAVDLAVAAIELGAADVVAGAGHRDGHAGDELGHLP